MSRRGRRTPDPHGPNALENYLKVHDRHLDDLRDDFVLDDDLAYGFVSQDYYQIRGRIVCRHGLFVDVDKILEVNARNQAWTVRYSYHAGVLGPEDRPILRYDNAHVHDDQPDEHHRHRYDHETWQEIEPPEWMGREGWPHLNQVIEEVRDWWDTTGRHLGIDVAVASDEAGWWTGTDDAVTKGRRSRQGRRSPPSPPAPPCSAT